MKTLNYSKQRNAILDFLHTRTDHPTADVIYQNVRSVIPNISLGTVYRNLNQLADNGMILRLKGRNGAEHFDGNTEEHQHFICNECGAVEDIFLKDYELLASVNAAAEKAFSGEIQGKDIYFFGVCSRCFKQEMKADDRRDFS